MTFNYSVCKVGDDSYRVSGSTGQGNSRNTTQNFTQTYIVKVLDPDGKLYTGNPSEINTAIVGQADGLPTVQKSIYYDADSGTIHPYAVCTGKDVKRRRDAPTVFDVSCSFQAKTETESLDNETVSQPTDIRPEVTVSLSGKDRVLYSDFGTDFSTPSARTDSEQCWMFKNIKLQYPSPVVTQIPLLTLTISQYETSVTYAQIMQRSFKVNRTAWQGFNKGYWRLVVKNVSEVDIQSQLGTVTWAKVTYEATLSNDGYYEQDGTTWTQTGWEAQIPMIAPKYYDSPLVGNASIKKFIDDDTGEPYMGFLDYDEDWDLAATRPKFKTHKRYEDIEFSDFLQDF
jgi:hypothetical protein